MATLLYRLRADLRTGWKSLVVIALLVGLAGGAVLASLAAARRTDSAYSRLRRATNVWDVEVNPNDGAQSVLTMAELRKLPEVEAIARINGVAMYPSLAKSLNDSFAFPPMIYTDKDATHTIGRPLMIAGRQPAADDPNGVWVERTFADQHHLKVGQTFTYSVITQPQWDALMNGSPSPALVTALTHPPAALRGSARIYGIGLLPDGVVSDPGYTPASLIMTPAFAAAHPQAYTPYWGSMVKLKPGTDVDAFTAKVRALVPTTGPNAESIAFQRAAAVTNEVSDATDPQVLALEAFAGLTFLLGLVVVGQAVSRRLQIDARDNPTLAAMGSTRPGRMAEAMAKMLVAVVAGAILAVVIAIASSPLAPVGVVRIAEVHPGVALDWPVLLVGGLATIAVGALIAAIPAWRSSRVLSGERIPTRSRTAATVAGAGGSLAAVVGIRFGLEPGAGRTAVPVRTTLLAAATAVALVTAVAVFSASLDHLTSTPRLYGSAWDAQIELDNVTTLANNADLTDAQLRAEEATFARQADRSGSVEASSMLRVGEIRSGRAAIPAMGLVLGARPVHPTIVAGRAPDGVDEVALGQTTMDRLHVHIGDTVPLSTGETGPSRPVRVVGRAVLPGLAPYPGSDKAGLGVGALLTEAGWKRYSSNYYKDVYIFRYQPGRSEATLNRAIGSISPTDVPLPLDAVNRPAGVISLEQLRSTPTVLATLVALLLGAAVANALVVAVRRRRHDLAVLRTLGFTTGQVLRTVLWQATTVAVIALLVGLPLGLIGGRWSWTLLAERLGTVPVPLVSAGVLVAVGVIVLGLANLVGLVPGIRAARSPGAALRTE